MPYVAPNLNLRSVLLAKIAATDPITDPVPAAATDAMLIHTELNPVQFNADQVNPEYLTGSFTKPGAIIGAKLYTVSPQCYLQSSGSVSTAPFLLPLFESCGMDVNETAGPPDHTWTLTPLTVEPRAVWFYNYASNILRKIGSGYGTFTINAVASQPANVSFTHTGTYAAEPTAPGFPAGLVLPTPLISTVENYGLVIDAYAPRFHSLDLNWQGESPRRSDGNSPNGLYGIFHGNRNPQLTIQFEAEVDFTNYNPYADLTPGTYNDISWVHGPAAGSRVEMSCSQAQLINVQHTEESRRFMYTCTWQLRNDNPDSEFSMAFKEPGT